MGYRHPQGGQPKFLENAFKANVSKYTNAMIQAIKKAVE